MKRDPGPPRGLLRDAGDAGHFLHERHAPSAALADIVQHYWAVQWDLRGLPAQTRQSLPHPNVHLSVDADGGRVGGIHGGRFSVTLEGRAGVFGVKFRPGGFRSLLGRPVSTIRNRRLPLDAVFGDRAGALLAIDPMADVERNVARAEEALLACAPTCDPGALLAATIVDAIAADATLFSVDALARRWSIGLRSLQRLFSDYVGIGPKWVINRYRLHEAIERLHVGLPTDWPRLAQDLGYFDQAHFIRDFKALVGITPAAYARSHAPAGGGAVR